MGRWLQDRQQWVLLYKLKCTALYLDGEADEEISLDEIAEGYEGVFMVIAERCLDGLVFRYRNHGEYWEITGKTRGFA